MLYFSIASLFKKGLSENVATPGLRNAYNPQALSGVITNLFKKGLIENGIVGVINRRNGCGPTVVFEPKRHFRQGCSIFQGFTMLQADYFDASAEFEVSASSFSKY